MENSILPHAFYLFMSSDEWKLIEKTNIYASLTHDNVPEMT